MQAVQNAVMSLHDSSAETELLNTAVIPIEQLNSTHCIAAYYIWKTKQTSVCKV